jgi:hypothetical protein
LRPCFSSGIGCKMHSRTNCSRSSSINHFARSKLDPASVAAASCSCKRWRRLAGKERLWEALCHRDWDLTHPRDANLQPATYRWADLRLIAQYPAHLQAYDLVFKQSSAFSAASQTSVLGRRDSYISWQRHYGRYGKLAVRMRVAWWVVEAWTAQNLPAVRATLRWVYNLQPACHHTAKGASCSGQWC